MLGSGFNRLCWRRRIFSVRQRPVESLDYATHRLRPWILFLTVPRASTIFAPALKSKLTSTFSHPLAPIFAMVTGAELTASAYGRPVITIRSTLRRTNSAASSGARSVFPSVNRYPMVIFFPSIHPSLRSSCRLVNRAFSLGDDVLQPKLLGCADPARQAWRRTPPMGAPDTKPWPVP